MENLPLTKSSLSHLVYVSFGVIHILAGMHATELVSQNCHVTLNTNVSDHISDDWMLGEINLRQPASAVQCGVECVEDPRCVSFMVNLDAGICRLHAARITSISNVKPMGGFQSYDTCRAPNFIGDFCNNSTTDCSQSNTTCINGICQCDAGYSFSPPRKQCILKCPVYGVDFVGFSNHYISLHNDITLSDPHHLIEDNCQQACINTTDFTCRSLELSPDDCYLSAATKEDDPSLFYLTTTRTITHYQRQCSYD